MWKQGAQWRSVPWSCIAVRYGPRSGYCQTLWKDYFIENEPKYLYAPRLNAVAWCWSCNGHIIASVICKSVIGLKLLRVWKLTTSCTYVEGNIACYPLQTISLWYTADVIWYVWAVRWIMNVLKGYSTGWCRVRQKYHCTRHDYI